MSFVERLLGRTLDGALILGVLAVALMMIHVAVDVILRFVFLLPIPATISIVAHYYMVVVAFIPLACAERRDEHISVEVLTELFPLRVREGLGVLTTIFSAGVFALLTHRSFHEAEKKREIGTFLIEQDVKLPIWPSYCLLPIGTGLMTLLLAWKLVRAAARRGATTDPI